MSRLTAVILTKNEEQNIAEAVKNAFQAADEVLVVDSGSTDNTVKLAEDNGAQVIYRAWDNDFSAQRNYALEHVHTEWVLYLDADERLDAPLVQAIQTAINNKDSKQYSMLRRIHAFGFTYKNGIFKPDEVLRLFPVSSVNWVNKVHEKPVCNLPKERLKGFIEHYTYNSWQQWWDKAGHYTSIWAEDSFAKGKRTSLSGVFLHAVYGFFRAYIIQLGFLDGWSGLYSSIFHFIYILLKYIKLYEYQYKEERY